MRGWPCACGGSLVTISPSSRSRRQRDRSHTGTAARFVVALDPGHGGYDPGATHAGMWESKLVLSFARELKEDLLRTTEFDIVMTRDADRFVSLQERINIARRAGADVFVSLHADGLVQGSASGRNGFYPCRAARSPDRGAIGPRETPR